MLLRSRLISVSTLPMRLSWNMIPARLACLADQAAPSVLLRLSQFLYKTFWPQDLPCAEPASFFY